MEITIYQIDLELDTERLAFRSWDEFKKMGHEQPPAGIYKPVFVGKVGAENLEDVYFIFNELHPKGYLGRSLSLSDVVEIRSGSGEGGFFFCDVFGFQKVVFDGRG